MKKTDMDGVRSVAEAFALLPVEPNERFPFLVSHPFTQYAVAMLGGVNRPTPVNILEPKYQEAFRRDVVRRIQAAEKPIAIVWMLSKQYRFAFLDHAGGYLGDGDLGTCLRYIWQDTEHTNDSNVLTKAQLVQLFRRAAPERLMDANEQKVVRELPDVVTVYRGTTSVNSDDLRVPSWTLSQKQAKWFAGRFNDDIQNVFTAKLPKEGVLAYFEGEEEVVADPAMLEDIQLLSHK